VEPLKFNKNKLPLVCLVVFAIAIIAITVFKVSIGNFLLLAILLACPLIHIFMMKGHGGRKGKSGTKQAGKSCH
jgi:UPF0716 family protein affecting phage T7 exclusion